MNSTSTSTKIAYERQTCTRCLGSGRYSYNLMDGDRCYGCGGSGQQLTKRAAEAKRAVGSATRKLEVSADQLIAGDVIRHSSLLLGEDGTSESVTVVEVIKTDRVVGRSLRDGKMVDSLWAVTVKVRHADGSVSTVSDIVPHFVRRIRRTEEEIAAIVAVAMQFPGACKVEAGA